MTSGELLKQLFLNFTRRQDDEFRGTALRIIAEERQKNHNALASQLERILFNGVRGLAAPAAVETGDVPKDRERNSVLVEIRTPDRYLDEMVLSAENRNKIRAMMEEYRRAEILRTHGILARTRMLFCGPPGCGKTLCAEVMATELGLPVLYTRFDAIISSYLGETASNIRKVFDYATRGTWVLFFDEFDAIGKSREDVSEHGELKRVVNSFLQILDSFKGESIVISATNHEGLLDRAIWRRYEEIIYFGRPTTGQIETMLRKKLGNFPHTKGDFRSLARELKGMSHADVERVCLNAIRYCIVHDLSEVTGDILAKSADAERRRLKLIATAAGSAKRPSAPRS